MTEETIKDWFENVPNRNNIMSIAGKCDEQGSIDITFHKEQKLPELAEYNRTHKFLNVKTFLAYIAKYGNDLTTIYYDNKRSLCYCVIDELETGGFPEILTCEIDNKSVFRKIQEIESIRSGGTFLEFIKSNKLGVVDFMNLFHCMSAIKISSSVEKVDIQGKQSEYSFIAKSEVKGQVKGQPVDLPDSFKFEYHDHSLDFNESKVYTIEADLYYSVSKEGLLFIEIKVNNDEILRNEIDKYYYNFIQKNAPSNTLVVIGSPNYDYVKRVEFQE